MDLFKFFNSKFKLPNSRVSAKEDRSSGRRSDGGQNVKRGRSSMMPPRNPPPQDINNSTGGLDLNMTSYPIHSNPKFQQSSNYQTERAKSHTFNLADRKIGQVNRVSEFHPRFVDNTAMLRQPRNMLPPARPFVSRDVLVDDIETYRDDDRPSNSNQIIYTDVEELGGGYLSRSRPLGLNHVENNMPSLRQEQIMERDFARPERRKSVHFSNERDSNLSRLNVPRAPRPQSQRDNEYLMANFDNQIVPKPSKSKFKLFSSPSSHLMPTGPIGPSNAEALSRSKSAKLRSINYDMSKPSFMGFLNFERDSKLMMLERGSKEVSERKTSDKESSSVTEKRKSSKVTIVKKGKVGCLEKGSMERGSCPCLISKFCGPKQKTSCRPSTCGPVCKPPCGYDMDFDMIGCLEHTQQCEIKELKRFFKKHSGYDRKMNFLEFLRVFQILFPCALEHPLGIELARCTFLEADWNCDSLIGFSEFTYSYFYLKKRLSSTMGCTSGFNSAGCDSCLLDCDDDFDSECACSTTPKMVPVYQRCPTTSVTSPFGLANSFSRCNF